MMPLSAARRTPARRPRVHGPVTGNPAEAMMSRYKGRINGSALGALEIAFGVNNKQSAVLPNLTGFAMSLGFVVSGAVLVEYVFDYPGVGYLLLYAVENEDYALMQTLFLVITVAVLVAVLLMDFATMLLDPRARAQV